MDEASSKQKMVTQDKGESVIFNLEGNVQSSAELLKRYKIKREKLGKTEGHTEIGIEFQGSKHKPICATVTQKQGLTSMNNQVKLSNFAISDQGHGSLKRQLPPVQKKSNVASMNQANGSRQNQDPASQFVSTSKNKKLRMEVPIPQVKGSKQNHDPKGQFVSINQKKVSKEAVITQSKGSKSQSVSTSKKKLLMKASMTQSKGSSQKQDLKRQLVKKAVTQDDELRAMQQSPIKKTKRIPLCPPMLIDEFLEENGEVGEQEEIGNESEDEEQNDIEQEDAHQEEGGEINGASKKRTRGSTQCLRIHARATQDREEGILDDDGEPIGPTDKIVSDLSYFLGTIARNADFCPLIYTNFKAIPIDYKDRMWEYVNDKYVVPNKGFSHK